MHVRTLAFDRAGEAGRFKTWTRATTDAASFFFCRVRGHDDVACVATASTAWSTWAPLLHTDDKCVTLRLRPAHSACVASTDSQHRNPTIHSLENDSSHSRNKASRPCTLEMSRAAGRSEHRPEEANEVGLCHARRTAEAPHRTRFCVTGETGEPPMHARNEPRSGALGEQARRANEVGLWHGARRKRHTEHASV